MLDPADLSRRIQGALVEADVDIRDMTGTGDHFEARVVSVAFAGKTMVEQHQMVYAPLQALLQTGELHALSLRTFTPEQWTRFQERQQRKT
jgi:acid stress-induced BolA-like protein IbaG/YrbA